MLMVRNQHADSNVLIQVYIYISGIDQNNKKRENSRDYTNDMYTHITFGYRG